MISICILNWNNLSELQITLAQLRNLPIEHEIIVFDQGSTDGSKYYLEQLTLPNLTTILSPTNIGNSLSRNQMVSKAKYDYVLLLDADIIPIKNSIENLLKFLQEHHEYSIIGYNWNYCTKNWSEVTPYEVPISIQDVYTNGELSTALTQYGLFRKQHLLSCPFPEFFPFDREGWGGEDDLVGLAILENELGNIGMINGRCYYHNSKSSWRQLKDEVARLYAIRYIYYVYYFWFLSPSQKIQALSSKKIPSVDLDLTKYHYKVGENLGDVATDYIFKTFFPFFNLDESSENLFMFGGSIFDHIPNAEKEFQKVFKKVEMFGVGIANEEEILDYEVSEISIHPRGNRTYDLLLNANIKLKNPVGDPLQLFTLFPLPKYSDTNSILEVVDPYGYFKELKQGYLVSKFNLELNKTFPYLDLPNFLSTLTTVGKVFSSQIHPYFISLMMGNGAKLIPKDNRSEDLKYFSNLKFNMSRHQAQNLRLEIQKTIPKFVDSLFKVLLKYKK